MCMHNIFEMSLITKKCKVFIHIFQIIIILFPCSSPSSITLFSLLDNEQAFFDSVVFFFTNELLKMLDIIFHHHLARFLAYSLEK